MCNRRKEWKAHRSRDLTEVRKLVNAVVVPLDAVGIADSLTYHQSSATEEHMRDRQTYGEIVDDPGTAEMGS